LARIRTIKPEFQNSQSMGRVSRDARLTFIELWPQCDDAGRIRANSRMLASVLFPYDVDAPDLIDGWLTELENEGCLVRYKIDKDEYLQISHWDHQKIDHPQPSKLPLPPAKKTKKTRPSVREQQEKPREPSSVVRAVSSTVSGSRTVPISPADADDGFDAFYAIYPKKVARRKAEQAYASALKRATAAAILAGAQRYALSVTGKDPQYIAHPTTWLNHDRWLDDVELPQGQGPPINWDAYNNPEEIENQRRLLEQIQ